MKFSKEEKAMWIEDWRQSGKRAWAYANENGLCPQTFTRWAKKETEEQECFVELPVSLLPTGQQVPEILIEKGDLKIHIPLEPIRRELRAVIEVLGQAL